MRTREFPVLAPADERLVERLAVGLGDRAARVLGYLLLREEESESPGEPASKLAVRVGTGLSGRAAADALARLEAADLVTATAIRDDSRGRPPKAWRADAGVETTVRRVYRAQADALLARAAEDVDAAATPTDGTNGADDHPGGLRLRLNWQPNPLQAPFYAARAAGDYRDLDVTLDHARGSGRAVERLVGGEADVAVAGAATVVRERQAGAPVVPLALAYQRTMTVLYTTRDAFGGSLDGLAALAGRRVGVASESETGLLARLFLARSGVAEDVTVVELAGEEREALQAGRADVVTGTFADPLSLSAAGEDVSSLAVADHFPLYGPAVVTTEAALAERPTALRRFLAGTLAGWARAVADPAEAVDAVGLDGESAGRGARTFERAVEEFGRSGIVAERGWGWHEPDGWQRLRTALEQGELLHA